MCIRDRKYTPAGGKIAVSVVLWEMYVEVKVTDTGKGISESKMCIRDRRPPSAPIPPAWYS